MKPGLLRIVLPVALLLAMADTALAKRTSDYVPPPYGTRVSVSLFTLAPAACLLGVLSFVVLAWFRTSGRGSFALLAAAIAAACLLAGSCWAACDALNDEACNPWLTGGLALAAIFPVSVLLLPGRLSWPARIGLALATFPPLLVGIEFLLALWQKFGMDNGLPTCW